MENKDNGDKSPEKLLRKEHLSQQPNQKPKKKKKTNKKGKTESKNNEELTSKKHAHDKEMEKAKEREGLPKKPVDKVVEKKKPGKDHAYKPLRKKAKRGKFPQELEKGDEPARKSAVKVRALKFEEGAIEERTYQKAFITRMTMRSFSSWHNSMKLRLRWSYQWDLFLLGKSFDPYTVCFRLLDEQKFRVTAFDVYVTLDVPFKGREIIEFNKSSMDEEYDEVHAAWLNE
ncbi:LOW QUALITY PROTEIN: hypothetical protein Cgig2_009278 [Carnegiea gigantea]|uniref:Uncharacterized protein n=1 Tax=Carnegiea gigantea TaxID=171969 RepID=A0A9Q1GKA1_9CARY|nr:LOW QUALITY PROTEIN: hypothetical protein Cgig2_009278 [Carnegiea gigantea]